MSSFLHRRTIKVAFCLFQVNLEYLETKLESVDGEEVQRIQDNINSLFHHCVQALGEEHQIKVVNALQASFQSFELLEQFFFKPRWFKLILLLLFLKNWNKIN